ncbi:MAG: type I glyceraldehyde-3-phosphate dehydrogenase [Acidobacteriota bacterium]
MGVKVGINGFGRIGRVMLRAVLKHNRHGVDIVAVNDVTDAKTLAHLLRYDSVFGTLDAKIEAGDKEILVNGKSIRVFAVRDPAQIPWGEVGAQIVLESTGLFTKRDDAAKHLRESVRKVIISAPATHPDITIAMGVNHKNYDPRKHNILSNASCTTNCLAPVAKVLHETFGIREGLMTTIHSFTNDQRILDLPHIDLRRARAASVSMIPTTTGAAKAVSEVLPELEGKLDGFAIRVPTPNVSVVDLTVKLGKPATTAAINDAFRAAAGSDLKGILAVSEEPLVSVDFIGNPHSAIVDAPFTKVIQNDMAKVLAWYDNEWGFSSRVVDLIELVASKFD